MKALAVSHAEFKGQTGTRGLPKYRQLRIKHTQKWGKFSSLKSPSRLQS